MDIALMTEPQIGGTYEELLEIALWAERSGLVSFARSDHYLHHHDPTHPATDAFATLAGLARDTSTIKLCVLVSPITFRHPAVIAKNAVTIDQMSGGRLELGVGTGWMNEEHQAFGLPFPPRAGAVRSPRRSRSSTCGPPSTISRAASRASTTPSTPRSFPSRSGRFRSSSAGPAPRRRPRWPASTPRNTTSSSSRPGRSPSEYRWPARWPRPPGGPHPAFPSWARFSSGPTKRTIETASRRLPPRRERPSRKSSSSGAIWALRWGRPPKPRKPSPHSERWG